MAERISKRTVDALQPGDRDVYLWDSGLAGFGVKVTPSGRKVYLVQYRQGGRRSATRRVTIGPHGRLAPDQARKRAETILAEVALGHDPAAAKARLRGEPTIAEVADRYLDEHVAAHNKTTTQVQAGRLVRNVIKPRLGKVKVSALTRTQVKAFHQGLRATPYEANRALACLSKIVSLAAKDWELRPDNPCIGVQRFPEAKRERFYSDEELRRIGQTLDEADRIISELPGCTTAIRLLALTGMRMGEVLGLRWSDVDLPNRAIRLRDAKTGPRTVPLGAAAFELLGTLDQSSDYVVYGLNPSEPLAAYVLEKAWARLRIKAGVPDGRLHDFRHTAGTFAAQAGFNAFQIRDLLGHKTLAMTGRYVERATDPLRATADHFAGRVAIALNAKPASGDVVKFPAPRTQAG